MSELLYHGQPMTPAMHWKDMVLTLPEIRMLVRDTRGLQFYLEPGDGTRYCLTLHPLKFGGSKGWLVTSFDTSWNVRASASLWSMNEFTIGEAALALCNGNTWTQHLLDWWLKEVFDV